MSVCAPLGPPAAVPRLLGAASPPAADALGGAKGHSVFGAAFPEVLRSPLRFAVGLAVPLAATKGVTVSIRPKRIPANTDIDDADALHGSSRQTAHLAPPAGSLGIPLEALVPPSCAPRVSPLADRAFVSLEEILPALVRRIAWSGDARRGSVRLELGAGALSGATLLVRADGDEVHVALSVPPGTDLEDWRTRIAARLAARGLDVRSLDVE
jgi:hypothetical protein